MLLQPVLRLSSSSLLSARHLLINRVYYCEEYNVNSFATVTEFVLAARSKAWFWDRSPSETVGSNPARDTYVCRECYVLPGRGLCAGLITRPEES